MLHPCSPDMGMTRLCVQACSNPSKCFQKLAILQHTTLHQHVNQKVDGSSCRGTDLQRRAMPELPKPKIPTQTMIFPIAMLLCNHLMVHGMHPSPSHDRTVGCIPMARLRRIPHEDRGIEEECGVILLAWISRRSMQG